MLIDFSQILKTIDGKEIDEGSEKMTLKSKCVQALLAEANNPNGGVSTISADEKHKRYLLATKINNSSEPLNISTDDIVKIKNQLAQFFPPLIAGQCMELLENNAEK